MSETNNKTLLEDLKALYASLPEIIAVLENDELDCTKTVLRMLAHDYGVPIDLLEQFKEDRTSHAVRLDATAVNPSYWPRIEKIIEALAYDVGNSLQEQVRPPFADISSVKKELTKLELFDEREFCRLFSLSRLEEKYFLEFKNALSVACGYFHIADSFYAIKKHVVSERRNYDEIHKLSTDLKELLVSVQQPMFGFVVGHAYTGTNATSLLLQFISLNRTVGGLDRLKLLREELLKSDQTAWLILDQIGGHKANLPLYAFVHVLSQFLFKRSTFSGERLPIDKLNIRFIADCLKAFGVEYPDKRVKSTMEALRKKVPKLKTPRI